SRNPSRIFKGQTSMIKVTAHASNTSTQKSGTSYLKIDGHFPSGKNCTLTTPNFYVRVNGAEKRITLAQVKVNNPATAELLGGSGFVEFDVDNPSDEQITIKVYSPNAAVSPREFTLSAKTFGKRAIAVNGLEENTGTVYFDVESEGNVVLQKYTKLSKATQPEPQKPSVTVVITPGPAQQEPAPPQQDFLATGFAFLSNNALAILGALIIIVIVLILMAARL
ncbi:MAG: hypothetical protein NUV67_00850, partial [archaeon]|nr:hypothetical protein [archaeon]